VSWANLAFLIVLALVVLAMLWLKAPTPERFPWLVWAPDALLLGWGLYSVLIRDWETAAIVLVVLIIWFARTFPLWRGRRTSRPPLE
jgi:hypothetical protein